MRPLRSLLVPALLAVLVAACAGPSTPEERQKATVREIESRLLAPCCWMGTIDVHESPVSHELRDEIAKRVAAGESAARIEDDLAARYGDRIRVTPPGGGLSLFLYAGGALAFLGAALVAHRWVRRGRARVAGRGPVAPPPARGADARLEEQLDDELARLD